MNILVTGGLGFIGHNVVRMLQDQHNVTIIDSKTTYGIMASNYIESLIVNSDLVTGSEVMINALLNLLLRSKHCGVTRFVYSSS